MARGATTAGRRAIAAGVGLALVAVAVFGVLAPPERCPEVTVGELERASALTVDWFVHNQNADGTWLYQYDAEDDRVIDDYNIVRHAGAIMGLYQAAVDGYDGALDSGDAGLEWLLDHTFDDHGWTAIVWQGRVSVGSVALLAAGLVDRREATGDDGYDGLLRRLGGFMAAQTEPSGAVLAHYSRLRGEPVAATYSKYYTGEAYWALTRLHRTFPDEGWDETADRIGDYLATRRDDVEDIWPDLPDHWAAYGLSETVGFDDRPSPDEGGGPLTDAEVAYAAQQSGLFGSQVRWVSQRHGPWGLAVRGPHVPRGGGYGVVGEALTGLWRVAEAEPRLADLQAPLADRTLCIAGLAVDAQVDQDEAEAYEIPSRVAGAWFRDGETRMDDQQHVLAALLRTVAVVESEPAHGSGGDMPAFWLWLVALVAVVNPFRTALAVPRTGRARREVAEIALLGGLLAGLGAVVAAWAGGPLLDALDVSEPALRLAAGIVAGLAGALALVRRPPPPEPSLPGRRAALVPVALPLVATPALLVAAMSAHADRGFPVLLAALAIALPAVALLAAYVVPLTATPPLPVDTAGDPGAPAVDTSSTTSTTTAVAERTAPDTTARVVAWLGRLTAAALVATAVALVIDGVLAV